MKRRTMQARKRRDRKEGNSKTQGMSKYALKNQRGPGPNSPLRVVA